MPTHLSRRIQPLGFRVLDAVREEVKEEVEEMMMCVVLPLSATL